MAVSEVIQICPTIESLCDPIKGRPKSSFKNDVKKVYHCPIETCKYFHKDHHFEKMKFLRQHFIKVHKTKTFSCDKCGVQFPLESTLTRHKLICGVSYQCYCNAEYKSYEALLTHFKRKHNENACVKYKDMMGLLKAHSTAQNFQESVDHAVDVKAIILKNLNRQKLLVLKEKKNKTALSKETQTGMKMCEILPNVRDHQETSEEQHLRRTVSMQTSSEFLHRKRKRSKIHNNVSKVNCSGAKNNININNNNNNNISFCTSSTQTTPVKQNQLILFPNNESKYEIFRPETLDDSLHESCNKQAKDVELKKSTIGSSFNSISPSSNSEDNHDNFNFVSQLTEKKMISADDPNLGYTPSNDPCENDSSPDECKTDLSNLEFVMNDLIKTDFNLIMCSDSETQTPFEDYFDSSYMDTYTQTCDSLFSDLDFVDIETQTF